MKSIIVLGGGMVGSAMAIDLSKDYRVTVADKSEETLKKVKDKSNELKVLILNVTNEKALKAAIKMYDMVICAVPGFLGFQTLKVIIESGKDVVDISFFPENALDLDALAKSKNVTAAVDCGVAPGMSNIILGRYNELLKISYFECLVGGLPKKKKWPFNYKAPFSPADVIEEYTRPARLVENGMVVVKDPLSDCELVRFEQVGELEAFNSDGLRSLIVTMPHIPNMKEKTLRYPKHAEYIKVLKESGFLNQEKLKAGGKEFIPIEFSSRILFDEWKLNEGEEEFTIMRITIKGEGKKVVFELFDEYDHKTQMTSMARTTGYTATAAACLILEGLFTQKGIIPPEYLGKDKKNFDFIVRHLELRGVRYHQKTS